MSLGQSSDFEIKPIQPSQNNMDLNPTEPVVVFQSELLNLQVPFICKICQAQFISGVRLFGHCQNKHNLQKHCFLCNRDLEANETVFQHMRGIHGMAKVISCGCCMTVFKSEPDLISHLKAMKGFGTPGSALGVMTTEVSKKQKPSQLASNKKLQVMREATKRVSSRVSSKPPPVARPQVLQGTPRQQVPLDLTNVKKIFDFKNQCKPEDWKTFELFCRLSLDAGVFTMEELEKPTAWLKILTESDKVVDLLSKAYPNLSETVAKMNCQSIPKPKPPRVAKKKVCPPPIPLFKKPKVDSIAPQAVGRRTKMKLQSKTESNSLIKSNNKTTSDVESEDSWKALNVAVEYILGDTFFSDEDLVKPETWANIAMMAHDTILGVGGDVLDLTDDIKEMSTIKTPKKSDKTD